MTQPLDCVSWEFIIQLLSFRRFSQIWTDWISILLSSANTRICVNGELSDMILHGRELRQEDPLSLLFFVIVMDRLGRLFGLASLEGLLQALGRPLLRQSSLFTDDTAIFIHLHQEDIRATSELLNLFGNTTWLHTNITKSKIIPQMRKH